MQRRLGAVGKINFIPGKVSGSVRPDDAVLLRIPGLVGMDVSNAKRAALLPRPWRRMKVWVCSEVGATISGLLAGVLGAEVLILQASDFMWIDALICLRSLISQFRKNVVICSQVRNWTRVLFRAFMVSNTCPLSPHGTVDCCRVTLPLSLNWLERVMVAPNKMSAT